MKISIYQSDDYFEHVDGKWYLISGEERKQVTSEDCDIDLLECGGDGDTVYGSQVFGY